MRTFTLVFRFTDDPEDPNVLLITPTEEYREVLHARESLLNAVRDLYLALLEHAAVEEGAKYPELCVSGDRTKLTVRYRQLEKDRIVLCPASLLPQEGEPVQ